MPEVTRAKYLAYRCYKCGHLLTALEIEDKWKNAPPDPKAGESVPLCSCGSSHVSPGNVKWWEELLFPKVWKLWFFRVFLPWWRKR